MSHVVVVVNRSSGEVVYLSSFRNAESAYADAMVYVTTTHGVWHPNVDKKDYVNELLDERLCIKPCLFQG